MKILQVIPYFHWTYGGPVRVVYEISRELAKRGHEVTIYTTDVGRGHPLEDRERIELSGVDICYFKCNNNWLADNLKLHFSTKMRTSIRDNLKNFDIVHLQEFRGIPNMYVWYYARKYHVPYILQGHGAAPAVIEGQNRMLIYSKRLFDKLIENRILKNASRIVALSETEMNHYISMGIDEARIDILPNGIDVASFMYLPSKEECKKRYSIDSKEKVILYIGRLHKSKGIDILISAYAKLKEKMDGVKLLLIGPDDGYKLKLLEQAQSLGIKNDVLFKGYVDDDEKIAAFMCADVFVTPSFLGFPITFLEACVCGVPIVTTDKSDHLDWIDGKVGYVVKYDVNKISDAIFNILADDNLQKRFSDNAKEIVRTEYNWKVIVSELETIYKNVI